MVMGPTVGDKGDLKLDRTSSVYPWGRLEVCSLVHSLDKNSGTYHMLFRSEKSREAHGVLFTDGL